MTKRHTIEIESVTLFILAAGVGVLFAFYVGHKSPLPNKISLPALVNNQAPSSSPTPTTLPIPQPQVTSQTSPDGSKKLTMTVTTQKNLTKTFTVVTTDADGSNQQIVYTATSTTDSMAIPFNTWSPDNKYLFLTHTTASGTQAVAMRADGQPFPDGETAINATKIFTAKATGNVYDETTGWASGTLLVINTKLQDGSKGPSYWLEIPSKAVIQLSTQF